jgi:hypothetical protein
MTNQKKTIGCLLLIVVLLLLVAKPIIRGFQFCTPQDEVYQAIETNAANWQSYFVKLPRDVQQAQRFSISGEDHVVFTEPWDAQNNLVLFIPVIELRDDVLGSSGYIYSLSPKPLTDPRYEIEFISDNIYCYRFK